MLKKTIVILFGSNSNDLDKSLKIAYNMISNINSDEYFSLPLGITEEGSWLMYQGNASSILNGEWKKFAIPAVLSPDASHKGILKISGDRVKIIPVDIIISTLAEFDGKSVALEGIARLSQLPFYNATEKSASYTTEQMREYINELCS